MKHKVLDVGINAPYDLGSFNSHISDNDKKCLSKIYNYINYLDTSVINDKSKFNILILDSMLSKKKVSNDNELIYNIDKINDDYKISTGRYIGELNIGDVKLNIISGYSKAFENRLLNYSNNIYVSKDKEDTSNNRSGFKYIIEYLFLRSLRKSLALGFPRYYESVSNNDYNIKGNIDVSKYIINRKNNYKGIPYNYRCLVVDKYILRVVYKAYSLCEYKIDEFKDIKRYFAEYNPNILLREFSIDDINKAKVSKALNNPIYQSYRKVLNYAEIIIKNKVSTSINKENMLISGWLLDISELFELYLYRLIKNNFKNYIVSYQEEIPIYKNLFINRSFYPDIVMKKDNDIIVLDAKFKKMDFINSDIDREDIHQIHTYYSYYKSFGYNIKYTTLVYPTRRSDDNIPSRLVSSIFSSNINDKFGISYISVGDTLEEQIEYEYQFLDRIREVVG